MVSLLKMPAAASLNGNGSGDHAVTDEQTDTEKLWYLKELFPSLEEHEVRKVMSKCSSIDQAETELTKLSCNKGMIHYSSRMGIPAHFVSEPKKDVAVGFYISISKPFYCDRLSSDIYIFLFGRLILEISP